MCCNMNGDCFYIELDQCNDVVMSCCFFSSRRRHTICALVTGVQTCALPISRQLHRATDFTLEDDLDPLRAAVDQASLMQRDDVDHVRSEERRVGKECVSTCRSWWSPNHYKKNNINTVVM